MADGSLAETSLVPGAREHVWGAGREPRLAGGDGSRPRDTRVVSSGCVTASQRWLSGQLAPRDGVRPGARPLPALEPREPGPVLRFTRGRRLSPRLPFVRVHVARSSLGRVGAHGEGPAGAGWSVTPERLAGGTGLPKALGVGGGGVCLKGCDEPRESTSPAPHGPLFCGLSARPVLPRLAQSPYT